MSPYYENLISEIKMLIELSEKIDTYYKTGLTKFPDFLRVDTINFIKEKIDEIINDIKLSMTGQG